MAKWLEAIESGVGVMVAHDVLANRVVDLCQQKGIRVPQDLAVLSVGNHELLCELCPVPITSIDAAVPLVATRGAEMLEKMLASGTPCNSICIPPRGIVERRSTEITTYGDNIVAKVVAYIHRHVQNPVTVEDLLRAFPISRRTLDRRFAKYTGHSPAVEIRLARLRLARELVEEDRRSLSEIAMACGFADLSHMDRAFKEAFGQTPRLMRRLPP
jgi:LacI family transcriptional regulator